MPEAITIMWLILNICFVEDHVITTSQFLTVEVESHFCCYSSAYN